MNVETDTKKIITKIITEARIWTLQSSKSWKYLAF